MDPFLYHNVRTLWKPWTSTKLLYLPAVYPLMTITINFVYFPSIAESEYSVLLCTRRVEGREERGRERFKTDFPISTDFMDNVLSVTVVGGVRLAKT